MAFTNFETREINCKVLYLGPSGSGKTSNLRAIYNNTSQEVRAGILELADDGREVKFFDFLPLSLGHVKDFHLKLHLFTLPANPMYETVTSVITKGIDGCVFVADSRPEALTDNLEALAAARRLLGDAGHNMADLPLIFQYNKRDLPGAVAVEILRQELNPLSLPDHEATANKGDGVMETLQSLAKAVLTRLASSPAR